MNQLLNNRVGKKQKPKKKGCLFLFAASLAAVAAVVLFIWGVSVLTGKVIEARHGEGIAYALFPSSTLYGCYAAAMALFMGIVGLWYMAPTEAELQSRKRGLAPALGEREPQAMKTSTKWLITAAMLCGVAVSGAIAINSYRLVTPDGISTYFFAETKSYEWKQVSAYTIDCDSENGLAVTFTMRDGSQYEILQGVNSTTQKFDDQYTSVTHFAADLDENMVALQVPRNVKHMERAVNFYKSYEGLWPYVSKLIGYTEIAPRPDETAEETTASPETEATPETNPDTQAD